MRPEVLEMDRCLFHVCHRERRRKLAERPSLLGADFISSSGYFTTRFPGAISPRLLIGWRKTGYLQVWTELSPGATDLSLQNHGKSRFTACIVTCTRAMVLVAPLTRSGCLLISSAQFPRPWCCWCHENRCFVPDSAFQSSILLYLNA